MHVVHQAQYSDDRVSGALAKAMDSGGQGVEGWHETQ